MPLMQLLVSKMSSFVVSSILLLAALEGHAVSSQAMSPIYLDNIEFLSDSGNLANISFPQLKSALATANSTNETTYDGFDWTKAFPGSKISGHKSHLRIAYNQAISTAQVDNSTTAVSSLTFSVPGSMLDNGTPKAMDPTWTICRHIYVSSIANATAGTGDSCGFLAPQCVTDLKGTLTQGWMTTDNSTLCSGLTFDAIPASCVGTFGFARADVAGK
jgi:hypothetical protein